MVDAIVRTLVRLFDHAATPARVADGRAGEGRPRPRPRAASTGRWPAASGSPSVIGVLVVIARAGRGMDRRPVRGAVARGAVDRPPDQPARPPISEPRSIVRSATSTRLRLVARRTWLFFETFVGTNEHGLPPDNFQDDPQPLVAHRTSPTNIGMYLLATVSARDFGWIGTHRDGRTPRGDAGDGRSARTIPRPSLQLVRHADLQRLEPEYVSTVDSGNLAGHLLAVANACRQMIDQPLPLSAAIVRHR